MAALWFNVLGGCIKVSYYLMVCRFWIFMISFTEKLIPKNVTAESGDRKIKRYFRAHRRNAKCKDNWDKATAKWLISNDESLKRERNFFVTAKANSSHVPKAYFRCDSIIFDIDQKIIQNRHQMKKFKEHLEYLDEENKRIEKLIQEAKEAKAQ